MFTQQSLPTGRSDALLGKFRRCWKVIKLIVTYTLCCSIMQMDGDVDHSGKKHTHTHSAIHRSHIHFPHPPTPISPHTHPTPTICPHAQNHHACLVNSPTHSRRRFLCCSRNCITDNREQLQHQVNAVPIAGTGPAQPRDPTAHHLSR